MSPPGVRFRVSRLTVAVALVAVVMAAATPGLTFWRSVQQHETFCALEATMLNQKRSFMVSYAALCRHSAEQIAEAARSEAASKGGGSAEHLERLQIEITCLYAEADYCERFADHCLRLSRKYLAASQHPWARMAPDPPAPRFSRAAVLKAAVLRTRARPPGHS
jgi:hypothetical protein